MTRISQLCIATADPRANIRKLIDAGQSAGIASMHLSTEQAVSCSEGFNVVSVDVSPITAEDNHQLDQHIDLILRQLRYARSLGVDAVSIMGGRPSPAAFEFLSAGLRRLTCEAEASGLRVHLRNRYATRIEQPIDLSHILTEARSECLKLDIDIAEFHRASVNPCEPIWAFEGRIGCVRLANISAGECVPLAEGEISILSLLQELRNVKYGGPIILTLGSDADAVDRLIVDRQFLESAGAL